MTELPPNAKLDEMQLIGAATPDGPDQTPMPQLSKQMLKPNTTHAHDCCRAVKVQFFLPMNGTMT